MNVHDSSRTPINPIRVLIADDHQLFRDGLVSLLERQGGFIVVGQAADGEEAVIQAQKTQPDVVLMDIQMPRCSGLEATHRLIAWRPEQKIIILTISDQEQDLFEAIKAGAQGYLLKMSTSGSELAETVRRVVAGEAIITPALVPYLLAEFAAMAQQQEDSSQPRQPDERAQQIQRESPSLPARPEGTIQQLTEREREVLALVAEGLTNRQIAERLVISENTVRAHLRNILDKLHVHNRVQAALLFRQQQDDPG